MPRFGGAFLDKAAALGRRIWLGQARLAPLTAAREECRDTQGN